MTRNHNEFKMKVCFISVTMVQKYIIQLLLIKLILMHLTYEMSFIMLRTTGKTIREANKIKQVILFLLTHNGFSDGQFLNPSIKLYIRSVKKIRFTQTVHVCTIYISYFKFN